MGGDRRVGCTRIVSPAMDERQRSAIRWDGDVDTGELPTTESQPRSSSRRDDHYVGRLPTPEGDCVVAFEHDPAPRSGYRGSDLVHWHDSESPGGATSSPAVLGYS